MFRPRTGIGAPHAVVRAQHTPDSTSGVIGVQQDTPHPFVTTGFLDEIVLREILCDLPIAVLHHLAFNAKVPVAERRAIMGDHLYFPGSAQVAKKLARAVLCACGVLGRRQLAFMLARACRPGQCPDVVSRCQDTSEFSSQTLAEIDAYARRGVLSLSDWSRFILAAGVQDTLNAVRGSADDIERVRATIRTHPVPAIALLDAVADRNVVPDVTHLAAAHMATLVAGTSLARLVPTPENVVPAATAASAAVVTPPSGAAPAERSASITASQVDAANDLFRRAQAIGGRIGYLRGDLVPERLEGRSRAVGGIRNGRRYVAPGRESSLYDIIAADIGGAEPNVWHPFSSTPLASAHDSSMVERHPETYLAPGTSLSASSLAPSLPRLDTAPLVSVDPDVDDHCAVCFVNAPNIKLAPCHHTVLCASCYRRIVVADPQHRCVVCRASAVSAAAVGAPPCTWDMALAAELPRLDEAPADEARAATDRLSSLMHDVLRTALAAPPPPAWDMALAAELPYSNIDEEFARWGRIGAEMLRDARAGAAPSLGLDTAIAANIDELLLMGYDAVLASDDWGGRLWADSMRQIDAQAARDTPSTMDAVD